MGFEQEQEDKKKRQSELKKSMHYKDATSYKSFHEGTSNYLNLVDYYQQKKLKENQEILKNLGGGLEGNTFSNISEKLEMGDENHDIDLAFYKKTKDKEIDNIQGLKEAIKGLIDKSEDKKVTKILKNLLAKIVPIIDTDGEALKSYGLNTRYEELLGKYNKLKKTFEDSEKEAKRKKAEKEAKEKAEKEAEKKAEEAEKEAKKKAKEKEKEKENDDTSEEKPKQKFLTVEQNNLMVRLFPKQARELGLKLILEPGEEEEQQPLPQEEMPAPTPEEQREIIKEMTFSNLSEKVENKSDESIENENNFVAEFALAEYKKAREKVTANEVENDEEYEYEDEDDIITEEEDENIPEAPPTPEELKNASEEKQDNDNKENQKNENGLTEEEEKEKQDMIDEYTGNGDIKEEQYEYELLRTDYINKIELEISYSARLINNIISEEKAKEETKEEVKKIEEQEKNEDEDENEENITESLDNDDENEENTTEPLDNDNDDEKSDTTKNETTDQNNSKTNINTDICKFLLKLLRQKESSINTSKIKDIFMTHTMFNTLSSNGGMKKDNILEFIFKDDPDDYYDTSDNDKTKIDFSFARFLFRLYYTVSHDLDPSELNDKEKRGPKNLNEETEFTTPYKELIKGKAKKDKDLQKKSLDSLSDLIEEKLDDPNERNKDVYEQIAKYIDKLRDGKDIKIDTDKIKKLMANYTDKNNSNNLKDKIKMDAPIFTDENYFKIDSTINIENKGNDKSKNNNP